MVSAIFFVLPSELRVWICLSVLTSSWIWLRYSRISHLRVSMSFCILFCDLLFGDVDCDVVEIQVKVGTIISEETSELFELLLLHMEAIAVQAQHIGHCTAQAAPDNNEYAHLFSLMALPATTMSWRISLARGTEMRISSSPCRLACAMLTLNKGARFSSGAMCCVFIVVGGCCAA